jgi:hypothetical protein
MMTMRVTQERVQGSGRASSMKDTCDHRLLRHTPSPFQPRGNGIGPPWIVTIPQNYSGMQISRHFNLTRLAISPPTTVDSHCPSYQIMPGTAPETTVSVSTTCQISLPAIFLLTPLRTFGPRHVLRGANSCQNTTHG